MHPSLIAGLIQLRYKLLWAKVRSRNGRIALFLAGYLFLILILLVMGLGGFGAGLVAVRSGKAQQLAQGVLGGLFLNGLLGSVILGFGVNAGFSTAALRRYPLSASERMVGEHIIGLLDPIWIIIGGLEAALAFGIYVFGTASLGIGLAGVILLLAANYLAAKILARGAELLMQNKSGTIVLLAGIVLLSVVPSLLVQNLHNKPSALAPVLSVLRFTPPFAAGSLVAGSPGSIVWSLCLLLAWIAWLAAGVIALERRPVRSRVSEFTSIKWDTPCERLASLFGPGYSPLVARWLRYYWRNTRSRFFYLSAVPLVCFLTGMMRQSRHGGTKPLFILALGGFALIGFMGTGKIAVNLFGYDGCGFRRHFLVPSEPAATLRAGSYAAVLLSSFLIPLAALAWLLFSGTPFDARELTMLVALAVTSMFLFHGLALWTTIFSPRRGDFKSSFGNDMSLGGNILFIGGVMLPIMGGQIAGEVVAPAAVLSWWWVAPPAAALAAAFYVFCLNRASAVFPAHRERLLHIIEGRS